MLVIAYDHYRQNKSWNSTKHMQVTLKSIYIILSFSWGNYVRWPENMLDVDGRDKFGLFTDKNSRQKQIYCKVANRHIQWILFPCEKKHFKDKTWNQAWYYQETRIKWPVNTIFWEF